ncbi:MAG: DMT family transporter [Blastocatellia bacterium]|nr:DMT family transporter [Blastocatellia bacterium]
MSVLLSLFMGALTAIMTFLNGVLAAHLGAYASSTFIHLTGLLLVLAVLGLVRSAPRGRKKVSPLLFSGGAIGFLTVVFASRGFLYLGVSLTLALGLLGQTISAVVIDHYGWFGTPVVPFGRGKLVSIGLIVMGVAVMATT